MNTRAISIGAARIESLLESRKERAAQDFDEARWIVAAKEARLHEKLGFASLVEYLERIFGYSSRLASEKIRVAMALLELPEIAQSLKDGAINWSCAREISRVATKATEGEWLDAMNTKSVREIEAAVRGRRPGDRPRDRVRPELVKQTIHADVMPETMALWREAMMFVKKSAGGPVSEDEAIRTIARIVLGGPRDEGRATHQIVITRCADCGRIQQRGRGEEIDIGAHVGEMAECDAQRIDLREPNPRAKQDIPPAVRRQVWHRDHGRCVVPGCANTIYLDVHHLELRSEGGTHDPERLATLCSMHHARVHEGRLIVGTLSTGLTFHHADGTNYGGHVHAEQALIMSDAFEALVALGYRQAETRRALDAIRVLVSEGSDAPTVVGLALRELRKTS